MATYCAPIRHTDWHGLEPEESWREVEGAQDEVRWILELIDRDVEEGVPGSDAQLLDEEVVTNAHSLEADRSLAERFQVQADKWTQETQHLSSPAQMMSHPSYQAILGMAVENKQEVIRLLLLDLRQNRNEWFWALSYLTQANPIKPADAGKMDKMISAWTRWGREHNLI